MEGGDVDDFAWFRLFFLFGIFVSGVLAFVADGVDGGVVELLDVFGVVVDFLGLDFAGADGLVGLGLVDRGGAADGVKRDVGHRGLRGERVPIHRL